MNAEDEVREGDGAGEDGTSVLIDEDLPEMEGGVGEDAGAALMPAE